MNIEQEAHQMRSHGIAGRRSVLRASAVSALALSLALAGCGKKDAPDTGETDLQTATENAEQKIDFSKVRGFDTSQLPDKTNVDSLSLYVASARVAYDPVAELNSEENIYQLFAENRLVTNSYDIGNSLYPDIGTEMNAFKGYAKITSSEQTGDDMIQDEETSVYRVWAITVDLVSDQKDTRKDPSGKVQPSGTWDGGTYVYTAYVHMIRADANSEWAVNDMEVQQ